MKKFAILLLTIVLMSFILVGCGDKTPSDPITLNRYTTGGEFSFNKWQTTFDTDYRISESDGKTTVEYTKISSETASMYTEVKGGISAFKYLSFKISPKAGETLTGKQLKIILSDNPSTSAIIIGKEAIINFEEGTATYTFALTARTMLDNINQVMLIAQPGKATIFDYGAFIIEKAFFTKTFPEGAVFVNDPENAESPYIQTVDGWKHESNWSNYSLSPNVDGVLVEAFGAEEYARIYKYISPQTEEPQHNYFAFNFKNINMSITRMMFVLRGDVRELHSSGDYYVYHEQRIGTYVYTGTNTETTEVELKFPIGPTLEFLNGKMTKGLQLLVFIESHPDQAGGINPQDKYGSMVILNSRTFYETINKDALIFTDSDGKYGLTDHGNSSFTADYAGISINNWERINAVKTIEDMDTMSLTVENLGETAVSFEFRLLNSLDPILRAPVFYSINDDTVVDYRLQKGEDGGNVIKRTYAAGTTTRLLVKYQSATPLVRIDFRIEHGNSNATGKFKVTFNSITNTDFDPTAPENIMAFNNDSSGRYTLENSGDAAFNLSYTDKAIGDADRVQITSPINNANTLKITIKNNGLNSAFFNLRLLEDVSTYKMAAIYYSIGEAKFSHTVIYNTRHPLIEIEANETVEIVYHFVTETEGDPIVRTDLYFNSGITGSASLNVSFVVSTEDFNIEDFTA